MKPGFFIVCLCAVAALSACKQDLVYQGKPIDPMCFMTMEQDPAVGVDLQECTGSAETSEYGKVVGGLKVQPDGTRGYDFECTEGCMSDPYVMYEYIGRLKNGHDVVRVDTSGGGTGRFSDVREVEIKDNRLISSNMHGGDRCNGGIESASIQNGSLHYSMNVTPFDLVEMSGGNQAGFQAYEDIMACAVCCVGTANYEDEKLVSVTLTQDPKDTSPEGLGPKDACFYGTYNETYRAGKTTLNADALKAFGVKFNERCAQLKK